jgi:hypothetical protein
MPWLYTSILLQTDVIALIKDNIRLRLRVSRRWTRETRESYHTRADRRYRSSSRLSRIRPVRDQAFKTTASPFWRLLDQREQRISAERADRFEYRLQRLQHRPKALFCHEMDPRGDLNIGGLFSWVA